MGKRFLIFIVTILVFSGITFADEPKGASDYHFGLGINGFKTFSEFGTGRIMEIVGLDLRLKLNRNIGIIFNAIYQGSMYFYEDSPGEFSNPVYWTEVPGYESMDSGDYGFKYSQFIMMPDIALFIPMGPIQPYLAVGPTLDVHIMGDGYKYNTDGFKYWYDGVYGRDKVIAIGCNIKAGFDVFISFISIGLELNFFADDLTTFFTQLQDDRRYLLRSSWVGITALVYLF